MLRTAVSRFAQLLRNSARASNVRNARTSSGRKARLGLEQFEPREVLAAFTWTGAVSAVASDPDNWSNNESDYRAPTDGDDVYFGAMSSGSHDCEGLHSDIAGFNSLTLAAGYDGTVTIAADNFLNTGDFTLAGGAIAQPSELITPIEINGLFTWTGGVLNSNVYGGGVYINGGGTITPPQGGALTTGSTLVFGSSDGTEKTTAVDGQGTVLLAKTSDNAIFVNQNAKVVNQVRQVGSPQVWKCVDPAKGLLTLDVAGQWGYTGTGTIEDDLRVINQGGIFYLTGQATVELTGGNATTPSYAQTSGSWLFKPSLRIMAGCVLDVSASKGARISGGDVQIYGNAALGLNAQTATMKGTYEMTGGSIGFPSPLFVGTAFAWFTFKVDGDALWSGGDFATGIEGAVNMGQAHRWEVKGKLTVGANAKIVATNVGGGQQVNGTWDVIACDTTADATLPATNAGWTAVAIPNKKGFQAKK
ncbi:hypothetical protein R5W23_005717 [Gemmata sp. JC673]|uniref:Uncharacterized protein n=1 Tax=Gemmata algarum TaxID=2975278 RepID=A0ABU5ETQ9_9BACT|nr:hypothetical protein [Gemmata algarum]MDY3558595.1 hypothetical protein [Gemmata algarum]